MKKTAIITGSSRGIGAAVAVKLAEKGYNIVVNYVFSEAKATALVNELSAYGADAISEKADVCNPAEVRNLMEKAYQRFGSVDCLVNNAGVSVSGLIQDMSDSDIRKVIMTDLVGPIYCTREAAGYMIRQKSGIIVNISSVWGVRGASCESVYSAAKAGIIGFTQACADELGPSGIRVNCVSPGVIDTEMNARYSEEIMKDLADQSSLGRIGSIRNIADAVAFLCSEESSFITGQNITVDGGFL